MAQGFFRKIGDEILFSVKVLELLVELKLRYVYRGIHLERNTDAFNWLSRLDVRQVQGYQKPLCRTNTPRDTDDKNNGPTTMVDNNTHEFEGWNSELGGFEPPRDFDTPTNCLANNFLTWLGLQLHKLKQKKKEIENHPTGTWGGTGF